MITNYLKQTLLTLIIVVVLCGLFINVYIKDLQNLKSQFQSLSNKPAVVQPNITKTILYWGNVFGKADFGFGFGSEIFKKCEIQSCYATNNKLYLPVDKFDAVLFHSARFFVDKEGLPENRSLHQKYVFYSLESYFNTDFETKCNNHFYNWTMTFKRDSDIFQPYGRLVANNTGYRLPSQEDLKSKQKLVAWFASNCYTSGGKKRYKYVTDLQKHIPVDIYGDCGTLKCPKSEECYKMLERNYKFYLSFENSLCADYITEKVYNVLKYNVVPIALGFVDYDALFPKDSLIVANKFINPKHLATYLRHLDTNDVEYLKYFEWKKMYSVDDSNTLCNLCKKLHEPLEYSSYENISDWYHFQCVS